MAYEGTDTIVLFDELAYEDVLPLAWRPLPEPFDAIVLGSFAERNVRLLQACTAMEEHGQMEKPDENGPHHADISRLDMKLNLLIDMVGHLLVATQTRPRTAAVRFNTLGAAWQGSAPLPQLGSQGVLEIYLRECVVEPLKLVGRIAGVAPDGKVKAKFIPQGEAVADLIEKLAFRRHRRQIAGAKTKGRL